MASELHSFDIVGKQFCEHCVFTYLLKHYTCFTSWMYFFLCYRCALHTLLEYIAIGAFVWVHVPSLSSGDLRTILVPSTPLCKHFMQDMQIFSLNNLIHYACQFSSHLAECLHMSTEFTLSCQLLRSSYEYVMFLCRLSIYGIQLLYIRLCGFQELTQQRVNS